MRLSKNIKTYRILIFVLVLVALTGGFFIYKSKSKVSADSQPIIVKSPTPQYPKVEKYNVPILMYHYIRDASNESQLGKNLSVNPANFDSQMKWLDDNDYQTLKVSDLTDPDKKEISKILFQKKKPIAITFDDGYADAYTNAYPILKKYQMTATFYIIRNYVGKTEYMNQNQIDALSAANMEIGSHTLSHPDLSKLDATSARKQIFNSKEKAASFCYPAGKYNSTTIDLVQQAGYTTAVTTHSGIASQDSNGFELPRVRIEDYSGKTFGDIINAAFEKINK